MSLEFENLGEFELIVTVFFEFCFEFVELFEFEIRSVLWATAGKQIFLANPRNVKLG
jgi:hypothetical protein